MKYVDRDVAVFKIDLATLEDWKDSSAEALPIRGFISFYEACGIADKVREILEKEGKTIVPYDNILCNYFTHQAIKNFIKRQWQIYSIDIDRDEHVFWKDDQYGKEKHYEKNLSSKIESCLTLDFAHYCPGDDDDLEDYTIVIRLFDKVEEEGGEGKNEVENKELCS